MVALDAPVRPTGQAGPDCGLVGRNLFGHNRGLQLGQDRLALGQRQPERFRCQRAPLNGGADGAGG